MAIREIVKKRREEVFSLVQQGVAIQQLANTYGITPRQIENDLIVIRKAKAIDYSKLDLTQRLSEYNEAARQRMARICAVISDTNTKKRDLLHAIRLLQQEDEIKMKRDQVCGLLPQDVNINLNQFNLTNAEEIKIEFGEIPQFEDKTIGVKPIEDKKDEI